MDCDETYHKYSCVLCGRCLTQENRTIEHVVAASLGGALSTNIVICRECNSEMGNRIDAGLHNELMFLTASFEITNAREPSKGVPTLKYESLDGRKLQFTHGSDYVTNQRIEHLKSAEVDGITKISLSIPVGEKHDKIKTDFVTNKKKKFGE